MIVTTPRSNVCQYFRNFDIFNASPTILVFFRGIRSIRIPIYRGLPHFLTSLILPLIGENPTSSEAGLLSNPHRKESKKRYCIEKLEASSEAIFHFYDDTALRILLRLESGFPIQIKQIAPKQYNNK